MGLTLLEDYRKGDDLAGLTLLLIFFLPMFFFYPFAEDFIGGNAVTASFVTIMAVSLSWLFLLKLRERFRSSEEGEDRGEEVPVK